MGLFDIFSRKKADNLIGSIDKLLGIVDHSLLLFRDGVKNYLYRDESNFIENLTSMASLETEAGAIIREIESTLYSRGYLIRSRGDIMRLLERFDHIISIISVDLVQFEIESPNVPAGLRKEFVKLSELASLAVESTIPGTKAYFTRPGDVAETTDKVYFYEKEAVKPAPGTVLAEWYFATSQVDALAAHFSEAVTDDLADAPGNGGLWVEPNVSGNGRLEYYNGIDKAAAGIVDKAHKRCKRAIGSYGEPVVYGTYKGDYILWTAYAENESPLAAGTKLSLYFVLRPNSFLIMKYWLVEYLDGDEWKVAGTAKEADGFKYNVELTFAEGSGNQTNTVINPVVTLSKDTEAAIFRITATSDAGCMDGAPVTLINASHALRFAGEDCNANTPHYSVKEHPMIKVVE